MAWLLVLTVQVGHEDFCAAPNSSAVSYVRYVRGRFDRSLQGLDLGGAEWVRVSSMFWQGERCLRVPASRLALRAYC